VAASLVGFAVNAALPAALITAWAWRIPFALGCLVIPFLFILRRSLQETAAFAAAPEHPTARQILRDLVEHAPIIGAGMLMVITTTVSFYTITTYTPTFGQRELHLSASASLLVTLCVGLSNLAWLPVWGGLSDRFGRKRVMVTFTVLILFTAYPTLLWLAAAPSFGRMLAVELWLSFTYAGYNGAMTVALTEIVPARIRVSAFSLAYSLATTLGGFSLVISTGLIELTGDKAAPGLWMSFGALCGLAGTLAAYRRSPLAEGVANRIPADGRVQRL
jgi:MHS family citrate/tricarballylate:H+ symporter-like MFS transporter